MYFRFIHFLKITVRVCAILGAMMIATASQATVYFVDQNKTTDPGVSGSGLGDWSQAFMTFEEALLSASAGDTIRIAEGTYTPNDLFRTFDQTQTYLIDKTLIILGGYEGEGGLSLLNRDPKVFLTILSGDFQNPPDSAFTFDRDYLTDPSRVDNAFTVVTVLEVTDGTRIEGFIIERGNRGTYSGSNASGYRGGGMLIDDSQMDVVNCTFRFNAVGIPGLDSPGENGVTSDGGGASVRGGKKVANITRYTRFINCTFHDNFAARGGGLSLVDGSPTDVTTQVKVVNSLFYDNQALEMSEADILVTDGCGPTIVICNSIFRSELALSIFE
ncbi:MAG: hypothetical protein IID30_15685 [Planctomycetes bacterium]|nr:hypothetical protein [Planctomycetota bacterium]